jgi:hypothetical protein
MAIKEDWKDIGSILGDDKDNHSISIRRCTSLSCNAPSAKTAFVCPTAIAKPIR